VVDDFVPWRNYVIATLAENPALNIVGFASDGLEAVLKAAELQPDLILMDVNLPSLSGISAARRIQELSLKTKILFVSQILDVDVALAALDAGGLGYVVSPTLKTNYSRRWKRRCRERDLSAPCWPVAISLVFWARKLQFDPAPRKALNCLHGG
jgi:DNA-binding NarL/FixJ family response regulator